MSIVYRSGTTESFLRFRGRRPVYDSSACITLVITRSLRISDSPKLEDVTVAVARSSDFSQKFEPREMEFLRQRELSIMQILNPRRFNKGFQLKEDVEAGRVIRYPFEYVHYTAYPGGGDIEFPRFSLYAIRSEGPIDKNVFDSFGVVQEHLLQGCFVCRRRTENSFSFAGKTSWTQEPKFIKRIAGINFFSYSKEFSLVVFYTCKDHLPHLLGLRDLVVRFGVVSFEILSAVRDRQLILPFWNRNL